MNKTNLTEEEIPKDNGTQTFSETEMVKVTEPSEDKTGAIDLEVDSMSLVHEDYIETPVVVREKRVIDERLDKSGYKALIEKYKTSNPKKYEAKKAELEKKIADLGKDK